MLTLAIIIGHLVGDYILQNDFIASRKASDSLICGLHCALYTLALMVSLLIIGVTWTPFTWWFIFTTHFFADRYSLARWWMIELSGQKDFATGPCSPWSVIIVDNTFHLLCAYVAASIIELHMF